MAGTTRTVGAAAAMMVALGTTVWGCGGSGSRDDAGLPSSAGAAETQVAEQLLDEDLHAGAVSVRCRREIYEEPVARPRGSTQRYAYRCTAVYQDGTTFDCIIRPDGSSGCSQLVGDRGPRSPHMAASASSAADA